MLVETKTFSVRPYVHCIYVHYILCIACTCTVFPRISARALISYRGSKIRRLNEIRHSFEAWHLFPITYFLSLFQRYGGPTKFSNCGAPMWFVSTSYRRPPPTAAMAFVCTLRKLPAKWQSFPPSDALKAIARRTSTRIRLTN